MAPSPRTLPPADQLRRVGSWVIGGVAALAAVLFIAWCAALTVRLERHRAELRDGVRRVDRLLELSKGLGALAEGCSRAEPAEGTGPAEALHRGLEALSASLSEARPLDGGDEGVQAFAAQAEAALGVARAALASEGEGRGPALTEARAALTAAADRAISLVQASRRRLAGISSGMDALAQSLAIIAVVSCVLVVVIAGLGALALRAEAGRQRAEIALREAAAATARSQERFQRMVEGLEAAVWEGELVAGPPTEPPSPPVLRFSYLSPCAEAILGIPAERLTAEPRLFASRIHEEDRARAGAELARAITSGAGGVVEYRARTAGGDEILLRQRVQARSGDGAARGEDPGATMHPPARGLLTDVTRERGMEREAQRAERLDSLTLLAGGVAHDFNNLLQGLVGAIALAKDEIPPTHAAQEGLALAERAALRAQGLTRQLSTFARGFTGARRPLAVGDLVREAVTLHLRGTSADARFEIDPETPRIEGDDAQLTQVFGNLALNAAQAMSEGGGTLVVTAGPVTLAEDRPPGLAPGPHARLTFTDTGSGISPEHLPRVFDPYFSTKRKGGGLGLATAESIIRRHGGDISVHSRGKGEGATFTILLPATTAAPRPPAGEPARPPRAAPGALGRILVLDDEAAIRLMLGGMLRRLGYEAEAVGEGAAALKAWSRAREEGRPFRAAIFDLTIPGGMGGRDTMGRLLEADPQARAIVSSGSLADDALSEPRRYGFRAALPKPYSLEDLDRTLSEVLAG